MSVKNVWIFADKKEALLELCRGARSFGDKLTALAIGSQEDAQEIIAAGADHVYCFEPMDESFIVETYSSEIARLVREETPDLFILSSTVRGKLIAGRVATEMQSSVSSDVMDITEDNGVLTSQRMVYGGAAIRKEQSLAATMIATVGAGVFKGEESDASRQGTVQVIGTFQNNDAIKCIERRAKAGVSVNLSAAKRIVAVGRGITQQEDLSMINQLAESLGAELGCTRPISEGEKWLPRERYIGVSGVMQLKPEVYLAIGISGQVQHMVGCNQSKTVFAVNTDKNAPIFKQCDHGIVGDLYKIVPELLAKLN